MNESQKPNKMNLWIGGYGGNSYSLKYDGKNLLYSVSESEESSITYRIEATENDWDIFMQALDAVDIWNWESEYCNPFICDGTQWKVCIVWGRRSSHVIGNNCYPDSFAQASENPEPTEIFLSYLSAVKRLVGGQHFE